MYFDHVRGTSAACVVFTHRDEAAHNEEEKEGEDQDAEEGIDLVPPHAREDVVQLDVDGAERQEARHDHLGRVAAVPRDVLRNLPDKANELVATKFQIKSKSRAEAKKKHETR